MQAQSDKAKEFQGLDKETRQSSFRAFAVLECESSAINLKKGMIPFSDTESGTLVARNKVGTIVVCFDFAAMVVTLFVLWALMYSVRVDAERHRKMLFET